MWGAWIGLLWKRKRHVWLCEICEDTAAVDAGSSRITELCTEYSCRIKFKAQRANASLQTRDYTSSGTEMGAGAWHDCAAESEFPSESETVFARVGRFTRPRLLVAAVSGDTKGK